MCSVPYRFIRNSLFEWVTFVVSEQRPAQSKKLALEQHLSGKRSANTRIGVPNAKLAASAIDNYSARNKILYRPTLRLRYDSKPDQIREVLEGIREALDSNDRILSDHRVRFKDIGDDALKIEVFAYFDTTVWSEYLELAEDMNLKILEIVADAGTGLALPASTLKIEQDVATEVSQD